MIKYCGGGIPHNWDMSFGKFGGLPTVITFPENELARQKQIKSFMHDRQRVQRSAPHHWMHFSTRHSVLKLLTIGCSHFQLASNKAPKPTVSPVLTKWWNWELMLASNFGNLCQMSPNLVAKILATKFGFVPDCSVKYMQHYVGDEWMSD